MAVGDMVADIQSIDSDAYLDIQPAGTEEWIIHNIYHEDTITIERYDGSNALNFEDVAGKGVHAGFFFHVGNTDRIRVKNDAGSAKLVGYDGIISHT